MLSKKPPHTKLSELGPIALKTTNFFFFKFCSSTLIAKLKILWPLFQATVSNHQSITIFSLLLSEGYEREDWIISEENIFHPSLEKISCTSTVTFPFHLILRYTFLRILVKKFQQCYSLVLLAFLVACCILYIFVPPLFTLTKSSENG